jgi:hypothetical protein
MFLRVVKVFHTPGCHGRLYPGWRLLYIPGLEDIVKRFNRELEREAAGAFLDVLNNTKIRVYGPPNESMVITLESSESMLVISDQNLPTPNTPPKMKDPETESQRAGRPSGGLHLPGDDEESAGGADDAIWHTVVKTRDRSRGASKASIQQECLEYKDVLEELQKNQTVEVPSEEDQLSSADEGPAVIPIAQIASTLRPGETSRFYCNGLLEIQVENCCLQIKYNDKRAVSFCLDWLSAREVESLQGRASIVEAASIYGETPYTMGSDRVVFISHMGRVARIQLGRSRW